MFGWNKKNIETFRPVKKIPKEARNYKLSETTLKCVDEGNVREAVKLPPYEKLDEWLAKNALEFFNQISYIYAPLAEFCTPQRCPKMIAGPLYQYFWQDGVTYKKPTLLPAPEYIANVLSWVDGYINDEKYFPIDPSEPFPPDFKDVICNIFKRLFRIYAHIYHHHREDAVKIGQINHLDTSFRHFVLFAIEFHLIPEEQMKPLEQIIANL